MERRGRVEAQNHRRGAVQGPREPILEKSTEKKECSQQH